MLPFIRPDLAQFTAYTPHPEIAKDSSSLLLGPQELDRLDTNESSFDLPSELKQKLAWTYQEVIEANRYPNGDHAQLRQAIAEYVNESANPLTSEFDSTYISIGNGSDELIRALLIATCLQGQGAVLVANPTFSMYEILAQTLGIPVVSVGRSKADFEINLKSAQAAIEQSYAVSNENAAPPIRVVFVAHPNSPTGNPLTVAEQSWLESLPPHISVVVDEAYFEFSQTTTVSKVLERPNWIVLRTFSKAFRLAAHRVGYCVAHPELAATLEKVRLPYNLPAFSQAAAQIALRYRHVLLEVIPQILAERDRLTRAFAQEAKLQTWPSAANFLYLRLRSTTGSTKDLEAQLCQTLKSQGTLIRQTGGGLRITIGSPLENTRTLDRIQSILASAWLRR